jgi:hypothetical protein
MTSIFHGKDNLRLQYSEVQFGEVSGKNSTNPISVFATKSQSRMFSIINNLNCELYIMVVNPEDPNKKKIPMINLGPNQYFTLDSLSGGMFTIPAGTWFYYHTNGVAATSGKVRTTVWG